MNFTHFIALDFNLCALNWSKVVNRSKKLYEIQMIFLSSTKLVIDLQVKVKILINWIELKSQIISSRDKKSDYESTRDTFDFQKRVNKIMEISSQADLVGWRAIKVNWISSIYDPTKTEITRCRTRHHSERVKIDTETRKDFCDFIYDFMFFLSFFSLFIAMLHELYICLNSKQQMCPKEILMSSQARHFPSHNFHFLRDSLAIIIKLWTEKTFPRQQLTLGRCWLCVNVWNWRKI